MQDCLFLVYCFFERLLFFRFLLQHLVFSSSHFVFLQPYVFIFTRRIMWKQLYAFILFLSFIMLDFLSFIYLYKRILSILLLIIDCCNFIVIVINITSDNFQTDNLKQDSIYEKLNLSLSVVACVEFYCTHATTDYCMCKFYCMC